MAFYKLTKNGVTVIRSNDIDVDTAIKNGFTNFGECDKDGNLLPAKKSKKTEVEPLND